jgi:signal transduction histidine kinase
VTRNPATVSEPIGAGRQRDAGRGRPTLETNNAHIDEAYVAAHREVVPGQYVVLAVTDTGMGMDAQTQSQAFEPLFTTKPVGKRAAT